MNKKAEYKRANELYLEKMAQEPDMKQLVKGMMYQELKAGNGVSPSINNIVSVYYKGSLINGKVFDDNTKQGYPDAFRLKELITGWQIALTRMKVGDKWKIYLPAEWGYGTIGTSGIPGNSTLIFEIELVSMS